MRKTKPTTVCGGKKGCLFCRAGFPDTNRREAHEWDRVNFLCLHSNASLLSFWKNKSSMHQSSGLHCQVLPKSQWQHSDTDPRERSKLVFSGPGLRALQEFRIHSACQWNPNLSLSNSQWTSGNMCWTGRLDFWKGITFPRLSRWCLAGFGLTF